jgi:citrate synthase
MARAKKKAAKSPRQTWETSVARVENSNVFIRGYNILDIMGRVPFSAATYLLVRGELPTPAQARIVDTVLCSILDYSLGKSGTVAARFNLSGNPQPVAAIATSILGIGEYTIAPEGAGRFIAETYGQYLKSGQKLEKFAAKLAAEHHSKRARIPGFGHFDFRKVDPRAQVLRNVTEQEGLWGEICEWYDALHRAYIKKAGKPDMCINLVGMIAAVLSQLRFTPEEMTGLAVISTMPGVIAHITEELASGARLRGLPKRDIVQLDKRRKLKADLKSAGWD